MPNVAPPSGQSTAQVLSQPQLVLMFFGQVWVDNPDYRAMGERFFAQFLRGHFQDGMAQYGVGLGSVNTSLVLSDQVVPWVAQGTGYDIVATISEWMQLSLVPDPSTNSQLLYVFIAGPGMGPTGYSANHAFATNASGVGFTWCQCLAPPAPLFWGEAAAWWMDGGGRNYTELLSHEMWESFTDPQPFSGWTDPNFNPGHASEVCDIFEGSGLPDVFCGNWSTEAYWSNSDNACIAGFSNTWVNLSTPADSTAGIATSCFAPYVGVNADASLELFTMSDRGGIWHCRQNGANGSFPAWQQLVSDGDAWPGPFAAASNGDQRQEIFWLTDTNNMWHCYQQPDDQTWIGNESLGGPNGGIELYGDIAVGRNGDGRLEVFVLGWDGAIHHIWQLGPWQGWSGWGDSLGAPPPGLATGTAILRGKPIDVSQILVGSNADTRLEIFVQAIDNTVWHRWQLTPGGGWSDWQQLGSGPVGAGIVLGRNGDGRLELFAGAAQHVWQLTPNGVWSDWTDLPPSPAPYLSISMPATVCNVGDSLQRLQLYATGSDGAVWSLLQDPRTPSGWGDWRFLDCGAGGTLLADFAPAAALNASGAASVLARANDGNYWCLTQAQAASSLMSDDPPWGPLTVA